MSQVRPGEEEGEEARMKRPPFPAEALKVRAEYDALSDEEKARIRVKALKSNRYLLHEAAVRMGVCK